MAKTDIEKITKNIEVLHKEVLYPTVRVGSKKSGGSGTVIYSKETSTYVLTNYHVIEDLLTVKREWNPLLQKDVKVESRGLAKVEFFEYENYSHCENEVGKQADIVAYYREGDIALLKVRMSREAKYIANLYPKDRVDNIHIFEEIYAVGAALGHAPLPTRGHLVFMDDEIKNQQYWMSTASIIYGNSGGSVYLKHNDNYHFIGIPAALAVILSGFSLDAITHLGYFVPITRIYKFLEDNYYQFIYDKKYTEEECDKKRKKRREKEERTKLQVENVSDEELKDLLE